MELDIQLGGPTAALSVTFLFDTMPRPVGPLPHGLWATLAPIMREMSPPPEVDMMASAYVHRCRRFVDAVADWQSLAALALCLTRRAMFNPPFTRAVLTAVQRFLEAGPHAGAYFVVPAWRETDWYLHLHADPNAKLIRRWPRGTKGLFAPVVTGCKKPINKGISWDVELHWVDPR